jgi:hypothetical protein
LLDGGGSGARWLKTLFSVEAAIAWSIVGGGRS